MKKYKSFFKEAEKVLSADRIKLAKEKAQDLITQMRLTELRESMSINQTEIAGFTQSNVSRLEKRKDLKISTLIKYIHSLGMELIIKAKPKNKNSKIDEVLLLKA